MENNRLPHKETSLQKNSNGQKETSLPSVAEIIQSPAPQISKLAREKGPAVVDEAMRTMILDCATFFNIGKNMNMSQVNETIRLIRHEYYYLKIDDFRLFFENIKLGLYGKLYDRFDGAIILEWLSEYSNNRFAESENIQRKIQKERSNVNIYETVHSEGMRKVFEKVRSDIEDKVAIREVQQKVDLVFDDLATMMENYWEKRKAKKSYTISSVTFAFCYGREYSREEFLKRKYRQYGMLQQRRTKA